jgi:hypothetical protein
MVSGSAEFLMACAMQRAAYQSHAAVCLTKCSDLRVVVCTWCILEPAEPFRYQTIVRAIGIYEGYEGIPHDCPTVLYIFRRDSNSRKIKMVSYHTQRSYVSVRSMSDGA